MEEEKKIFKSQGIQFSRPKPVVPDPEATPIEIHKIEEVPVAVPAKVKRRSKKLFSRIILGVAVMVLFIYGGMIVYKHFKASATAPNNDPQTIIAEVGKLVELPTDEEPSILTVTDPSALAGQAFFKDAETGDKLLVYSKAKKAILYRESENRIIAIGPLNS